MRTKASGSTKHKGDAQSVHAADEDEGRSALGDSGHAFLDESASHDLGRSLLRAARSRCDRDRLFRSKHRRVELVVGRGPHFDYGFAGSWQHAESDCKLLRDVGRPRDHLITLTVLLDGVGYTSRSFVCALEVGLKWTPLDTNQGGSRLKADLQIFALCKLDAHSTPPQCLAVASGTVLFNESPI